MPLTLDIVVHDMEQEGFEDELKGILEAISQCSDRWHSLSLVIPSLKVLSAFQHYNVQCHRLKRLRIKSTCKWREDIDPVPFLNTEVGPEEIEIEGVPFHSLPISWNHLLSTKVKSFHLENIMQLFQNASQMTFCDIWPYPIRRNFSMSPIPIIHQNLKTLKLCCIPYTDMDLLLHSLTLPCLQDFFTNRIRHLRLLPALVQRSSCPLTRINVERVLDLGDELGGLDNLQPLPRVTDLALDCFHWDPDSFGELLLEKNFPDLRRLTLRLQGFLSLWGVGTISRLLDRKTPRPDATDGGGHCKIIVIDSHRAHEFSSLVWESPIGKQLKLLPWIISVRKDGFELSIREG
jgi:hypothetical protein